MKIIGDLLGFLKLLIFDQMHNMGILRFEICAETPIKWGKLKVKG